MKFLTFLTILVIANFSSAGGSTHFPPTKSLKCQGASVTAWSNVGFSHQTTDLESLFNIGTTPVVKISDQELIDGLIANEILVPNGLKNHNNEDEAQTLTLIFDSGRDSKQAHYVNLDGKTVYKTRNILLHRNSTKMSSLLDTVKIRHHVEFRGEFIGNDQIQLRITTIRPEIRHCLAYETVPNPWVKEATMEVCVESELVSEETEFVEYENTFSFDQCQLQKN